MNIALPYINSIPPALSFSVFICLALIAVFKGRRSEINLLFAGFCLSGALINIDILLLSVIKDKSMALSIYRSIYFLFVFSVPIYIRFVHAFLGLSRRWIDYYAFSISFLFLFFTQSDLFVRGLREYRFGTVAEAGILYHFFCAFGGLSVLYCLATLYRALKKTEEGGQKNRIKYILLGMGTYTVLLILNYLPISGSNIYPMGNFGFIPVIILAFGVLKYDLLDMDEVIRKGMIYFFLTGSLILGYLVILFVFNVLFMKAVKQYSIIFPFVLALAVVFLFDPIKSGIQAFTDRHFFKGKYDYRTTLRSISERMTLLLRYDDIGDFLVSSIGDALEVKKVVLVAMRRGDATSANILKRQAAIDVLEKVTSAVGKASGFVSHLPKKERIEILEIFELCGAALLIPIKFGDRLTGLLALGEKRSGELFVQEDIELLATIANQCAVALENAYAYRELEKLNHHLETKVLERTAELAMALREKERTQKQLIQTESLAAIGQLVAGAAHEINNPLSSGLSLVQTSIDVLSHAGIHKEVNEKIKDVLDDLAFTVKELERVRDIVKSLLDLSRQTQIYTEPVNINVIIDDALRVLCNQYKSQDVMIEKVFQEDLPEVEGNFSNLGQVFVNIIKNALQALPEGKGNIRLETCQVSESSVHIRCRDNGTGISSEHMRNIFKPFFTTKEVGRGTGLGLYISHEIIKKHGGTIDVVSGLNSGTEFNIELPLRQVGS